ncbi:cobalamin-binding protein [Fulvivirga sediminis]|uniref:Cobalamin-binding protein n=1 Tax=Fulvivirga sediminis TaxID=2803949 RepID=A0A937F2G3_9BACT|nr:cobalamin-binding protein [Fulvivirga sediminis]MBL3655071.1 cobalamin-binding protein [Fulvivirga sediminis]
MNRIVSLLPSSTEIVAALGLGHRLVGRSHECNYPLWVEELPVLTAPKFDTNCSSEEIDNSVIDLLKEGLSVYDIDEELLQQLNPDFILTQSLCDICAVSLQDVENAVCKLTSSDSQLISLQPNEVKDIFDDILRVGKVLGVESRAEELVNEIAQRFDTIRKKVAKVKNKPTVAMVEWISPLMLGGNWIPELVELAGGESLFAKSGEHSHYHEWESVVEADPDIIVVMPCGFDVERAMEEMCLLAEKEGWNNLKAVKNEKVFVADGNHFFNRPGPSIAESAEILSEIFYPELFPANHKGTGYVNYSFLYAKFRRENSSFQNVTV